MVEVFLKFCRREKKKFEEISVFFVPQGGETEFGMVRAAEPHRHDPKISTMISRRV